MKVEQACRFRLEGGYGISARSAGFDAEQEKVLGELFNDSMNQIFPKIGTSVLSCAVRGSYAFFARNTLRSDIHSRYTIFTHSYALPAEEYARMMQQMPQRLLAVPMAQLMDIQPGGNALEDVEFPAEDVKELSLDELFEKYQLTPQRYSKLLAGAYEAITSNRSLRLYTSRTIVDTEQMVRELTYCIVEGLLPILRGRVTFSSGSDTRMNISVVHAGGSSAQSGDLIFGVEDDRLTNLRPRDDVSAAFFYALGKAEHDKRREILQNMEHWLWEITNLEEGLSVTLIAAAFFYCSGQTLSQDVRLTLFRSFAAAAGKTLPMKVVNALLTGLVEDMIEENAVTPKALSFIGEWYLKDSSQDYRDQADRAFGMAPVGICVALADAIIKLPPNESIHHMLQVLLARVPPQSAELTDEVKVSLIHWFTRENAKELADFCEAVMANYSVAQMKTLAGHVLSDCRGRELRAAEMAVLTKALDQMAAQAEPGSVSFSREECALVDEHMGEFSEEAMSCVVAYFLKVRLNQYERMEDRAELLVQTARGSSVFARQVVHEMSGGTDCRRYAQLWENYQTKVVFAQDVTGKQVSFLCRKYNTFSDAQGPFERKAVSLWVGYVTELLVEAIEQDRGLEIIGSRAKACLDEAGSMKLSAESRNVMKQFTINKFWELLTYDHIINSRLNVPYELKVQVKHSEFKLPLLEACGRLMHRPNNAQELVVLVMDNRLSDAEQQKLQKLLLKLACKLLIKNGFLSWDLLLLSCWQKNGEYDFDRLNDSLVNLQEWIEEKNIRIRGGCAGDSVLLQEQSLRKTVSKKMNSAIYEVPGIVEDLLRELKRGNFNSGWAAPKESKGYGSGGYVSAAPPKTNRKRSSNPPVHNPFVEEMPQQAEKKDWISGWMGKGKNKK